MRARDLAAASLVALAAACASQDAERVATPAPLDAPAPAAAEGERDNHDDELGLAEYERLLADKETRLRAAGVLLAAREPMPADDAKGDGRFAPPPPPAPAPTEEVAGEVQTNATKSVQLRKRAAGGRAGGARAADAPTTTQSAAPAPAKPKATTTAGTTATREKKVTYNPEAKPAEGADHFTAADENAAANRCQNICDLSSATCELEGKICDLAARHPDDPRYGDLCRRADDDCRLAAEACQRCSP